MGNKKLDGIIGQLENYLECWKQFNTFINLARGKKFGPEDETQFLEVKSVLAQELEMVLASFESPPFNRDDIHAMISSASSLRNLSELNENAMRTMENQWHKYFITLQSVLGQLKVQQRQLEGQGFLSGLFGKKK